jgi:pimeloyl-ACP methyl ester carboxylesterase
MVVLCLALSACGFYKDIPVSNLLPLYANSESEFIEVDGMDVHYRIQGKGPTLVLLHGSSASLHTWEGWVETLQDSYTVVTLDLPAHGLTGPDPKHRYGSIDSAEFVHRFVEKLELGGFALAGNSRGGSIAWHYAILHPENVNALILINASGLPSEEPLPAVFRLYQIPVLEKLLSVLTPKWLVRKNIEAVYGDPQLVSDAMVQQYHDIILRAGNRTATAKRFTRNDKQNLHARIAEIKVPSLILWGGRDSWILPKYAPRFNQLIKGSKLVIYPELGHVPMEEAPTKTALEVKRFLAR